MKLVKQYNVFLSNDIYNYYPYVFNFSISQDYFCNLGTSQCIGQGVMVILQIETDVFGYRIQLVVR